MTKELDVKGRIEEIWKPVLGYEGYYEVSNMGNVRSMQRNFIAVDGAHKSYPSNAMKLRLSYGYEIVTFTRKNIKKNQRVHRLVATAFIGRQPTPIHQVNHKDSNRVNNSVENLEWVTPSENLAHRDRNGRQAKGSKNSFSKLNEEQVKDIRNRLDAGEQLASTARLFGISPSNIWRIRTRRSWRHI